MPTETEAKFRVDDLKPTRTRLKQLGAELIGEFEENNRFFDDLDRRLFHQDQGLRLRTSRNRQTGETVSRLTFKGPRGEAVVKTREEIELAVDDPAACELLLERLGFQRSLHFEKTRQSWRLEDCRVELDTLPQLGLFIEIEGPSEKAVLAVRNRIGLAGVPIINETYPALLDAQSRG